MFAVCTTELTSVREVGCDGKAGLPLKGGSILLGYREYTMKKATRVNNEQGIRNLCEVASVLLTSMPVTAATTFAVRTVLREAVNKSNANYRGNNNRLNVRYVSAGARALQNPQGSTVAEHMLPISVLLNTHVYADVNPAHDTDALVRLVGQFSTMALITHEEDARLRAAKLQSSMPQDWNGADLFARYTAVGIEVMPVLE